MLGIIRQVLEDPEIPKLFKTASMTSPLYFERLGIRVLGACP